MALPSARQDREYKKFVENLAGDVAIRVVATDATGADMLKPEDSLHVSGDPGMQMLAVRNDTLGSLVTTDGDYGPIQLTASGEVSTHDATLAAATSIPTTLTGGSKTKAAAAGAGEALGASLATKSIYIRAKSANTGDVYIGDSTVDANQIILSANDSVTLNIANRATVFVDVAVNGEGVDYLCMS